jgi:glutamine amidotransferase
VEARRAGYTGRVVRCHAAGVLPGVGHFDHAMQRLNDSGMRPRLEELVLGSQVPVVGICVGMQMLAQGSDEGSSAGAELGAWACTCIRKSSPKVPICLCRTWAGMSLQPRVHTANCSAKGFEGAPQFYFLCTLIFLTHRTKQDVAATASYGRDFDAVVSRRHIHGVQCHPEKSHHWGEQLLKNFVEL